MALTVKTQQNGSIMSMTLSLMRCSDDFNEYDSQLITVNNLAKIIGRLKASRKNGNVLQLIIGLEKTEAAKNLTVLINISSEGTEKHIICQDQRIEVPVKSKPADGGPYYDVHLYTIVVNITAHVKVARAPAVYHQLHKDTEFTDFKLKATDGTVAVHKLILLNTSDFFRTMLKGPWKETEECSLNMEGVSMQTLQHLKDYMYLGSLPDEGLDKLLFVARWCLMDNLVACCSEKLITQEVRGDAIDIIEFASENNIPELMKELLFSILYEKKKLEDR